MTIRTWSHSVHHWHLPSPARSRWPRRPLLPSLHLSPSRVAALRRGAIVALCALLAGGLTYHLRGLTVGPYAPTSTAAAARA